MNKYIVEIWFTKLHFLIAEACQWPACYNLDILVTVIISWKLCDIVRNVWVWCCWWIWYWGCIWQRLYAVVMFQQYVGQHWFLPYISAVCIHSLPCARMMLINLKAAIPTAAPSSLWLGGQPWLLKAVRFMLVWHPMAIKQSTLFPCTSKWSSFCLQMFCHKIERKVCLFC